VQTEVLQNLKVPLLFIGMTPAMKGIEGKRRPFEKNLSLLNSTKSRLAVLIENQ
jgi:hypothetical protein